jgi:hypothetical protein
VAGRIESRVLRTAGISEAALAERIADIRGHMAPLTLAFLPHGTRRGPAVTCRRRRRGGRLLDGRRGAAARAARRARLRL